jgi:hypothetical protein
MDSVSSAAFHFILNRPDFLRDYSACLSVPAAGEHFFGYSKPVDWKPSVNPRKKRSYFPAGAEINTVYGSVFRRSISGISYKVISEYEYDAVG